MNLDWAAVAALTGLFGVMLLGIQRAERRRRLLVALIMLGLLLFIRGYILLRDFWGEAYCAFPAALVLNFLFWAVVGRHNPPGSSDDIEVIGAE